MGTWIWIIFLIVIVPPESYVSEKISIENPTVNFQNCTSTSTPTRNATFKQCCPPGLAFSSNGCVAYSELGHWQPDFLDESSFKLVSFAKVNPTRCLKPLECENGYDLWINDGCDEYYPALNGSLAFIGAHRSWRFLPDSVDYCFAQLPLGSIVQSVAVLCSGNLTLESPEKIRISYVYMVSMYIGAFFHLVTALVYGVSWRSQQIPGKILFSCMISLTAMKLLVGNGHLMGLKGTVELDGKCVANGIGAHFFLIASFTWLLIVNLDLWRRLWYSHSSLQTNSKSSKGFLYYSLFGWGFPLGVVGISVVLNYTYPCRSSLVLIPEYGKRLCFVAPWAQGYYLYYILGILMGLTCILAVLTLTAVYRVKRQSANLRTNQENMNIFLLLLKMSSVMGLSYIFEVISWAAAARKVDGGTHLGWLWMIFDVYNALSGILIFIILVCKQATLASLFKEAHPTFKCVVAGMFTKLTLKLSCKSASPSTPAQNLEVITKM